MANKESLGWPAWIWAPDYTPAGAAEWSVDAGDMIALGWVVRNPLGPEDRIMVIRATRGDGTDGGVITLALSDVIAVDTRKPAPVRNTQYSRTFHDGDWE